MRAFGLLTAVCLASTPGVACTFDMPAGSGGGAVTVLATSPQHFAADVARDGLVHVWFSRPLDPGTLDNEAFDVTSAAVRQPGLVHYDPVDRRLTYRPRGSLRPDLAYDVALAEGVAGLREGESVEWTPLTFVTGTRFEAPPSVHVPDYAAEIEPMIVGSCVASSCHGGPSPAAGLDLSSREAVRSTAVGTPATGWMGWDVIDPGSASYSYLVYKVLFEPSVRGEGMPPFGALTAEEQRAIARWIDGGAKVDPDEGDP